MSQLPKVVPLMWIVQQVPYRLSAIHNMSYRKVTWLQMKDVEGRPTTRLHVNLPLLFSYLIAHGKSESIPRIVKKVLEEDALVSEMTFK